MKPTNRLYIAGLPSLSIKTDMFPPSKGHYQGVIIFIQTSIHSHSAKMAEDMQEDIVNALNTIASSTERSSNMKELKDTIYESVSTLRKLF
jgi:hypothetical protein